MILKTTPYQHQKKAYTFMHNKNYFALYMDMGTGKTRTIIEFIKQKKIETVLYFCPVSLKSTVKKEFIKHIKSPNYIIIDKQKNINNIYQIYIIGIESINSDRIFLLLYNLINKIKIKNTFAIVDESTYIKNMLALRTKRIIKLTQNIKYKCVMTGTPLTNYYQDLFSQMYFLSTSIINLRSYFSFCGKYLIYHDKYKNYITGIRNKEQLLMKIKPYIFEVKKNECIDLPNKIYKIYYFDMSEKQKILYENRKEQFFNEIDSMEDIPSYIIFKLFSDLQKIVNVTIDNYNPRLYLILSILNNTENKFIIFCKYINDIKQIASELNNNCYIYTGSQTIKERDIIIENSIKEKKHILFTYGVGGIGLNLTHYSHMIFYNSLFQYEKKIQAEDRIHRIGQKEKCIYYNIICENSIDERIHNNLNNKEQLILDFKKMIKNNIYF